jgi:hypothetical protein
MKRPDDRSVVREKLAVSQERGARQDHLSFVKSNNHADLRGRTRYQRGVSMAGLRTAMSFAFEVCSGHLEALNVRDGRNGGFKRSIL